MQQETHQQQKEETHQQMPVWLYANKMMKVQLCKLLREEKRTSKVEDEMQLFIMQPRISDIILTDPQVKTFHGALAKF